ncbi:MAG TPA: ABC transporter ATP-binding protein, partial [Micromonosporaceae bacterium]
MKMLKSAGPGLLTGLVALTVIESLVPAATAVAFAVLIGRVAHTEATRLIAAAAGPLLLYLLILLAGHVVGAVREPLNFLAVARIDGDHRVKLARLTSMSPTIGALERPEVQALIRATRADP